MITYLKNMEGWKHKDLKSKDFDSIKELFDKALKRVNMFVDFRTELVEGSSKRAGTELEQEVTKKQKVNDVQETAKVDDDQEAAKIKELMEINPDEEEVAIDAIPLAAKHPSIIDWKIHKEGKKSYYQIIKADGKSQVYLVFSHMLKNFDREDLETLWKLVKAKHGSTRPKEGYERVLWGDLKIYMLVEKKYHLTPATITNMLNKKLQIRSIEVGSNKRYPTTRTTEDLVEKLYQLSYNNEEMEADEDDNPDDIDIDLFTFDVQEIKTYEEHEYEMNNNMTGDLEEPWSKNGDYKWYDKLADGLLKEEPLIHKARFKESWGDATLGVMKLCAWLKSSFENFHELDHDVLVKLEECWWKVNTHECVPFTRWENHGRANNAGDTQDSQGNKNEHEGNEHTLSSKPTYDPSVFRVRREIIKYSFDANDEYVAIKEHEYFDHSRTNIDTCQAYRELFRIMDEGWLVTKAKEEAS
ncbi:hypothetical protein Tco_0598990 [Tanacetum coccineum]